jgi:hypothetical protein
MISEIAREIAVQVPSEDMEEGEKERRRVSPPSACQSKSVPSKVSHAIYSFTRLSLREMDL